MGTYRWSIWLVLIWFCCVAACFPRGREASGDVDARALRSGDDVASGGASGANRDSRSREPSDGFSPFDSGDTLRGTEVSADASAPGCESPMIECGGECVNRLTSSEHCGDCGRVCKPFGEHTEAVCLEGRCERRCEPGWQDLNDDWVDSLNPSERQTDGCELECQITNGGTEVCDDKDNDCNGVTDDGYSTGECNVGTGACKTRGTFECVSNDRAECNAAAGQSTEELCGDRVDNDCDGQTDEGFSRLGEPCTRGSGQCQREGKYICTDSATDVECSVEPGSKSDERCDGQDNDCDGEIDEDFDELGKECGVGTGACAAEGTMVCLSDGSGTECSATKKSPSDEVCDGSDNDCDGSIDEDFDKLGDECTVGEGTCRKTGTFECDPNGSGTTCSVQAGPGQTEICDGVDNDCDGQTDEEFGDKGTSCTRGRGVCESTGTRVCNSSGDGLECDATPGESSTEICDGKDNDCDGTTDESDASDAKNWFVDCDSDGFAPNSSQVITSCSRPAGSKLGCSGDWIQKRPSGSQTTDCDDSCRDCRPDGTETCGDNLDNDCDGSVDEPDAQDARTWYRDDDGDGFGLASATKDSCTKPTGYVHNADDCNDSCSDCAPGGSEMCDGKDNDCDGTVDEADAQDAQTWYRDADGDGFGLASATKKGCTRPGGYVSDSRDCNDGCSSCNPNGSEVCDGMDNNCDGQTDEDYSKKGQTCTVGTGACQRTGTYVCATTGTGTACNTEPGSPTDELCGDDIDNDCDGQTDESDASDAKTWYVDCDSDGYAVGGASSRTACSEPDSSLTGCSGSWTTTNPAARKDCDDADATVTQRNWYKDSDGDGYGEESEVVTQCSQPTDYVSNAEDCDDGCAACNPSETEVCDSNDNDCDTVVDESDAQDAKTWYVDCDTDGYAATGAATRKACDEPTISPSSCSGGWTNTSPGSQSDCDDTNGAAHKEETWYGDCDGDGYAVETANSETSCGKPSSSQLDCGLVSGTWTTTVPDPYPSFAFHTIDCNDRVAEAYPGQSQYFDTPQNPAPPSGDEWDYDCSGSVEGEYGGGVVLTGICDGSSGTSTECTDRVTEGGWSDFVPACGKSEMYISGCTTDVPSSTTITCGPEGQTRTRSCR